MTKVNSGNDAQASLMGGDVAGVTGTATASSATTLTTSGLTSGIYVGHLVVAGSSAANFVYGVITANTTTVITVDRWSVFATPGGTVGSTPSATAPFAILPGAAPSWFMASTANVGAPAGTDTALTGEITTAGGGLIRKIATYAHTTGAASFTLSVTWTANGSDSLPVTIHKVATFDTLTGATGRMTFESVMNADATLSASGDQLTVTETVTM